MNHRRGSDDEHDRGRPCPDDAEILSVAGEFRLVRVREGGETLLALEEQGVIFLDESDGDEFHEFIGIHFGCRVELAVALAERPGK